jgi:hypothetical protein
MHTTTEPQPPTARPRALRPSRRTWLLAATAFLLAVAAVLALLLTNGGDDGDGGGTSAPGAPREVSVEQLRSAAEQVSHPVYWAGAILGRKLELTENARGHVYVRYLPGKARIGDDRPAFTTVGTYPLKDAYQATERSAERRGSIQRDAPGGGLAVWTRDSPTSVYLTYPGSDVLVEVYDPDPARARELVLSGEVGPIR